MNINKVKLNEKLVSIFSKKPCIENTVKINLRNLPKSEL